VLIGLSDIRFRRIPNNYVWFLTVLALALAIVNGLGLGVLSGVLVTFILSPLLKRLFGFGDIKLVMALSFALPWNQWLVAIWLTTIFGGLLALFYLLKKRVTTITGTITLPYGVAICGGFYLTIVTFHLHSVGT
jgi:prepilin peptidase CpaA